MKHQNFTGIVMYRDRIPGLVNGRNVGDDVPKPETGFCCINGQAKQGACDQR